MPALPPVPNVVRFTLTQSLSEDVDVVNKFYIRYTHAAPTNAELVTWAGTTLADWETHMAPQLSHQLTLTEVTIEDLTSATSAVGSAVGTEAGTDPGESLPGGSAFVIQEHIARRYRGGHPRIYLAGIPNTKLFDLQSWDPTWRDATAVAWRDFVADVIAHDPVTGGGDQAVNVSYYHGFTNVTYPSGRVRPVPTLRSSPVVDVINGYGANPKVASQRRRNKQSA